jgi:tetratricopeptide (TPR) repeat protein
VIIMRYVRLIFISLFLLTAARAQTVQWVTGASGDPADLQLVFENCTPDGDPRLPALADATISFAGRSEQTSIVNFDVTRSVILAYRVRARNGGSVQIPAFTVKTNKGDLRVAAFTTGAMRQAADANVHGRLEPGANTLWAGEVFPLTYTLDVARRTFNQLGSPVEWSATPLIAEDWSKAEPSEVNQGGEARLLITYRTRAYAKAPGNLTVNATNQLVNLIAGTVGFGLFQQQRIEQLSVTSNQPALVIKPLPQPASPGFTGAVGQFRLNSKVVPASATVGEPVTWTLELSGTGNWPDIAGLPAREVSKDFQVIQPQAKRTPTEGKLFDVTFAEDVVLVPTRPGTYTLGPVEFTYFDPKAGAYKTLTTPRTTVTVNPPAAPKFNITPPAAAEPAAEPAKAPEAPAPAVLPAAIPRDPLPGQDPAATPFARTRTLAFFGAAPFVALALGWLALAIGRARRTDPALARREAKARLAATLQRLSSAPDSDRRELLLAWQHDSARLWQIVHAAPAATAFGADAAWAQLWQESERALYGTDGALPSDWHARATAALAAKSVPGFAPWRAFLPRNLLPFLFAVAVLLAAPPLKADAIADYRQGDFAAAEKIWRAALAENPTDWIARHNLALALAQQDRWPEAAAHTTAAFVQKPGREANRWNLALVYEKAGYTPAEIAPFLTPGPRQHLARFASPAVWEQALIASSALAALALGWLILSGYHRRARWTQAVAALSLVLALGLGAAALTGRSTYGPIAHPQAALVWHDSVLRSIPTEADTTQKTTPLGAGTIGIIDQTFLGWVRLSFTNGQTGWVRQDDLVRLWK